MALTSGLGLVMLCATLAATASTALAKPSSYSAVVTPRSAAAGATQVFNVVLTNETASNGINSAMITPPKGFTLLGASSLQGTIQLQPNKVIVRDLNLAPLGTVNVLVTAIAPPADPGSTDWKTQAFSNGQNSAGPALDTGASRTSTPTTNPQTISSDCPANQGCSPPPLSTPSTSFSMGVGSGATDATVTESVDVGTPMDGPGGLNDPGCATYTPQSPDWYGFDVSATDRSKDITFMVKDSDPSKFKVCFGAPYEFQDETGSPAPPGTLPDGTAGFVGLLPRCSTDTIFAPVNGDFALSAADVAPPTFICANISGQPQADGSSTTTATLTIPPGLPGDPFIGR